MDYDETSDGYDVESSLRLTVITWCHPNVLSVAKYPAKVSETAQYFYLSDTVAFSHFCTFINHELSVLYVSLSALEGLCSI